MANSIGISVEEVERRKYWLNHVFSRCFSFPIAIAAILVGKAFWTCHERIVDPDLGWHLRNGQYLLSQLRFPAIDSYSFTAAGSKWLDHSWLPEVLYYSSYRVFGLRGVLIVFTAAVTALLLSIFRLSLKRAEDPLAAAVVTILGGLLAMVGFTPRAQNFGWLCFAAIFAILLRFRDERRASLWLVPFLFLVWINCHGSWPIGLAVFAIILGSGWVRRDFGSLTAAPWTRGERKQLTTIFGVSLAALFINPFGWRLVLYPFDLAFRQKVNVGLVEEWASVNFNDARGLFVLIALGAVFAAALLQKRGWRIDDVLLTALALFCGLKHIRFLVFTGIVLPPIFAPSLGRLSSYDPAHERRVLNGLVMATVMAIVVLRFPTNQQLQLQINQFFPSDAVQYLNAHPQQGNMFNQYEWGGYLEWKVPGLPTFIDSRTDIFEYKGVLQDYVAISAVDYSQELLDKYQTAYVLYSAESSLSYFLSQSTLWECVYRDKQAVIFRRVRSTGSS